MSDESNGPEHGRPQKPDAADTASLRPTAATAHAGAPAAIGLLAPGAKFGRYTIVRPIGAGGMGAVYEATQESPRRSVALKVIRGNWLSPQLLRRFEHESQVLGRLQHPGIAQVYEAGSVTDERGEGGSVTPFFAMELIKGVPLTDYAAARNLGTRERLELVARICDAVYHAHQKGVIHRDLKPGNILVDESGQPKVLDFGVARATDSDIQQTTMQTDIGQLIGTVPYMSPEQVGGDPNELDTRSDVYALGVIAYELLAGRLPYDLQKKMIHEAVRVIREEDPTRLSSINRTLRGDIETIVGKALEKDKARRYQSAEALGSDIRRYLKDEPIAARPASTWYQAGKFARRNKVLVGGVAATFLVLVAGIIGVSLMLQRALEAEGGLTKQIGETTAALKKAQEAEAAERRRADELKQVSDFQEKMLAQVDPTTAGVWLTEDVTRRLAAALEKAGVPEEERIAQVDAFRQQWVKVNATDAARELIDRTILRPAAKAIDEQFADQPLVDAQLRQALADRYRELGLYEAATPLQESALATRQGALGGEHPDTLASIGKKAGLLREQGRLSEAEAYVRSALDKCRRVLGNEHSNTLSCIGLMGQVLVEQGRWMEAEPYFLEAMETSVRTLGADHTHTLVFVNNWGYWLHQAGRLAEAETYYLVVLEARRRVLGDEHESTLTAISNVGTVLRAQGRVGEAEPYYREVLEARRRVLGEEHPHTLISLQNMAVLLDEQKRVADAEQHYVEAIEMQRRVIGPRHPNTLTAMSNFAFFLRAHNRLSDAEARFREVLEHRREVLGNEHPETIASAHNLAGALLAQGRLQEAEPYYREAIEKRRRVLGEHHPATLTSVSNYGFLLRTQGRYAEAEPLHRDALEGFRLVLGEDHRGTLSCISNMGVLLMEQGRLSEAEQYLNEAMEKRRRVLGNEHPDTIGSIDEAGELLCRSERYREAIDLLAPAEAAAREAFTGSNARRLAALLTTLGRARVGLGYDADRFAMAEANLLEAHPILVQARGEAHKDTTECVAVLVNLYSAWHAAEPDKGYDAKAEEWRAKLVDAK
ncbi:MAG: serine/threonine protein kinase [Phycisphaeraceae bacterium]|nr:serine/threonine protein kinase [Phycisphaeraceae bacterium]